MGGERCRRGVLGVGGEEVWVVRGVGEGCWVWGVRGWGGERCRRGVLGVGVGVRGVGEGCWVWG